MLISFGMLLLLVVVLVVRYRLVYCLVRGVGDSFMICCIVVGICVGLSVGLVLVLLVGLVLFVRLRCLYCVGLVSWRLMYLLSLLLLVSGVGRLVLRSGLVCLGCRLVLGLLVVVVSCCVLSGVGGLFWLYSGLGNF